MNYTLDEYANDVVYRIASVCNTRGVDHPMIVSESGRAIAAHHSVLIFNTLGSSRLDQFEIGPEEAKPQEQGSPQPIRDLYDALRTINERRLVECYHDAQTARDEALQMFNLGLLTLAERGLVERLYWAACSRIRDCCRKLDQAPEELEDLEDVLADIYFCNFSLFQSLPDSWAIDQLFPIMPIHRLAERPTRNGVLADITCDSDGRINRFVSRRETKRTLELHELNAGRGLLPRRLPGRRLPGDARRPAQPVRRHPRRAHQAARGRRLVDRGDRQGRYREQRARIHGVRRRRTGAGAGARLRARRARGAHDAWPKARRSSASTSRNSTATPTSSLSARACKRLKAAGLRCHPCPTED